MISAQPNKPQQEKLIAKLMELPNNAVCSIPECHCEIYNDADLYQLVGFVNGPGISKYGCSCKH